MPDPKKTDPSSPELRLLHQPMRDVAAAIGRVIGAAPYSDDAHALTRLQKLCLSAGEIGFADFCELTSLSNNTARDEQLNQIVRDLQARIESQEAQLRARSDELAAARAEIARLHSEQADTQPEAK